MDAALWTPPKVHQAPWQDAFWNALVSRLDVPFDLGRTGRLVAALQDPPPSSTPALTVRFGTGAGFVVCPVSFPFAAAFGSPLTLAEVAGLPAVLRDALYNGMLDIAAAALPSDLGRGGLALLSAGPLGNMSPDAAGASLRWLRLTLTGFAPEPIVLDVGAPLSSFADVLGAGLRPRVVTPGLGGHLNRDVDVTLGRAAFSASTLRGLTPGSVIVLHQDRDPSTPRLRLDGTLFGFAAEGSGWRCTGGEPADQSAKGVRNTMEPDRPDDAGPSSTAGTSLGSLDVMVDFDIGRMSVPLAEIETWRPGSVVALRPVLPRPGIEVTLRVNGRPIASGDLIDIDGRLAIRLAALTVGP